ncbi:hypothetical protein [Chelatococcus reniformis]|uniref:Uncharacterized protein n=1 Tax=Chelatococcus reniformis TaxID=1494448 RepID=A0A916XPA3_9HYPH|nr:hypothetical protein [Chelatococcus reniformis]GGC88896.1 hypothetical protein GCM10010994_53500 [Chelatococcus reniformis]
MVRLDRAGPLVTLQFVPPYGPDDERAYLDALCEIGRNDTPFALLTIFGGGGKLSPAGEREQALWFKATRGRFDRVCRALAMVRPGASEQMAHTFRRLWSMPLTVAGDEATARAFLAPYLAEAS